jgi:dihydroorotase
MAKEYRERIKAKIPAGHFFEPLMTIYLTARTTPDDIYEVISCYLEESGGDGDINCKKCSILIRWCIDHPQASKEGIVKAVKWYPAGATTNSDFGTDYDFNPLYFTVCNPYWSQGVKETDLDSVHPTLLAMVP